MLSVSKKTDYALLALSHLAGAEADRAVNTREIAERYAIPVELLAKVLQKLVKSGILISTAGVTGGYRLARPAACISVGEVVAAIDGPPAITPCLRTEHEGCEQAGVCTVRGPLAAINARIIWMLNRISLAEMRTMSGIR